MTSSCDVLVIGAGPAGSASAAFLAERGFGVTIVERDTYPRFHIGESLLPCSNTPLARLGIDMSGFLVKEGAEFVDEATGRVAAFRFADALDGGPWPHPQTWQVERADLDARLLRRAVELGARHVQGNVREVELGADEVAALLDGGERLAARYLIDASGQHAFLARRHKTLALHRGFGQAAVFRHVFELGPEARAELETTGNIKVLLVPDGWVWVIPLGRGRLSVGVVKAKGKVSPELLEATFADSPLLTRLTAGCPRGPVHIINDFSYINTRASGPRWACVGDASCFLDPVFSSGVSLALTGAMQLAALLGPALSEGREHDPALVAPLEAHMKQGYLTFAAFIHRFYATGLVQNAFFVEAPDVTLHRGIVSVLAGDVWRDDNPFQRQLLEAATRGRRPMDWPPT